MRKFANIAKEIDYSKSQLTKENVDNIIKKVEEYPDDKIIGNCCICNRPLVLMEFFVSESNIYCIKHYAEIPYNPAKRFEELLSSGEFSEIDAINLILKELRGESEYVNGTGF